MVYTCAGPSPNLQTPHIFSCNVSLRPEGLALGTAGLNWKHFWQGLKSGSRFIESLETLDLYGRMENNQHVHLKCAWELMDHMDQSIF